MAVKVSSNKSSKAKKDDKSYDKEKLSTSTEKSPATKASFSVEPIENGFIVSKSWTDENGHWQNKRHFCEENPLELEITKK